MTTPPGPPPADRDDHAEDHREVVGMFAELGQRLARTADTPAALTALCEVSVDVVPGARWASVTRGLRDRFVTMASSDAVGAAADRLQYRAATGPCIDAVLEESIFFSNDLAADGRWSVFGPQVVRDLGVHSVLSVRLLIDDADPALNAALNFYSDRTDAFGAESRYVATILATHAAVAVAAVSHRDHARHLEQALQSNREIGVAMGVLMSQYRLTRDEAFDLLRLASQNSNRKLRDVATEVADTGALDVPRPSGASRGPRSSGGPSDTTGQGQRGRNAAGRRRYERNPPGGGSRNGSAGPDPAP